MNTHQYILGIDTGLKGFNSLLENHGNYLTLVDFNKIELDNMKDKKEGKKISDDFCISYQKNINVLKNKFFLNDRVNCIAYFEQLTPRPIYSCGSNFTAGTSFIATANFLEGVGLNYRILNPRTIKEVLGLSKDKKESFVLFNKLVENGEIVIDENLKKLPLKNHNFVESVLIGYYAWKNL